MPTNLYGPRDNYDLHTSHVLPALIRKAHEAKIRGSDHMVIWGSGHPRREFLHVDDLADACVYFINHQPAQIETADWDLLNIGTGSDVSIAELARYVADVVGFSGELIFDASKPDGTPRKVLDVSKASDLGWTATITLQDGLEMTYQTFLEEYDP
jgi:Nucleoside-diphosphate-sugar epimerases